MVTIGLTGASGFIGWQVAAVAQSAGHRIVPFSRRPDAPATRLFGPQPDLSGLDAVIHLAGESILGRWTPEKKRRILASRVEGTRHIVEALRGSSARVLVCASAIGFYGPTRETIADETSPAGEGFLASVCRAWEAEAQRAEEFGLRVVRIRIGFVIGRGGGAMKLVAPIFRLGLGGRLGNGCQWMSGIHVDDVAGLFVRAATDPSWTGPINAVMPEPFRNADFTRAVARAVRRPALLPAPAFALRLALGEMAHVLLDSTRVRSSRLDGYPFRHPTLSDALAASL